MSKNKLKLFFLILWITALLIIPSIASNYFLHVLIVAHILAIFALSWDLIAGYVGELSLGHSIFFGFGAYSVGYLNSSLGFNPWVAMLLSVIIAGVLGGLVGIPCLRLKGPYLGIVTLAFQMVLYLLAESLYDITGGEEGISGINRLVSGVSANYYLSVIFVIITFLVCYSLIKSKYGLVFKAIRENQDAAEASGVKPINYKLLAYIISAVLAGLAGNFQANYLGIVTPDDLSLGLTFSAITIVAIGGRGTLLGALIGAYAVTLAFDQLYFLKDYRMLVYSVLLIVSILFFPKGFVGTIGQFLTRKTAVFVKFSEEENV